MSAMIPDQIRTSQARDDWKPLRKNPSMPAEKYRIGEIGFPWGEAEKAQWLAQTTTKRSYLQEVVAKLEGLDAQKLEVRQYGALQHDPARFPLFAAFSKNWDESKPCVLVTGGVHGYETSGVQGAILFLQTTAPKYCDYFNIVVLPCISPWGYERVERWNKSCQDPNRSFGADPATHTEESAAAIAFLRSLGMERGKWLLHVDQHETTNTDETEFMPARAALSGSVYKKCEIPDGFYLVCDTENNDVHFNTAVIESVKKVTHICPGDANGAIIEEPLTQEGVICVPADKLGLCGGVTGAKYATTTEVYPDSSRVTDEQCNRAQVAVVEGALDFILEKGQ
mmetsp:Transcript_28250/g.53471  ORF Transcript_28250/g.53471 Transcript_28250/m.53471 type:complete len:339 (+) Transcript_28250:48-1064(+)